MADVKINDLAPTVTPSGTQQLETDINGLTSNKITLAQIKTFALAGNADSATKLQTARSINGQAFDGTADITVPPTQAPSQAPRCRTPSPAHRSPASEPSPAAPGRELCSPASMVAPAWRTPGKPLPSAAISPPLARSLTLNLSNTSVLTLPTSGTLATLAGTENLTNKTVNGLIINTTTGTLGLANGSTLATAGAFSATLTTTANSNVTLPTTGTLATLAGNEALTNKTINGLGVTTTTGTLAIGNGATFGSAGAYTTTITSTANTAVTLPTSGTLSTLDGHRKPHQQDHQRPHRHADHGRHVDDRHGIHPRHWGRIQHDPDFDGRHQRHLADDRHPCDARRYRDLHQQIDLIGPGEGGAGAGLHPRSACPPARREEHQGLWCDRRWHPAPAFRALQHPRRGPGRLSFVTSLNQLIDWAAVQLAFNDTSVFGLFIPDGIYCFDTKLTPLKNKFSGGMARANTARASFGVA